MSKKAWIVSGLASVVFTCASSIVLVSAVPSEPMPLTAPDPVTVSPAPVPVPTMWSKGGSSLIVAQDGSVHEVGLDYTGARPFADKFHKISPDGTKFKMAMVGEYPPMAGHMLDESGELWSWFKERDHGPRDVSLTDLPIPGTDRTLIQKLPFRVYDTDTFKAPVRYIATGGHLMYMIDSNNKLFVTSFHEYVPYSGVDIGFLQNNNPSLKAQIVKADQTFQAVQTASSHTVALGADGKIWSWGSEAYGEVGDGLNKRQDHPQDVTPAGTVFRQIAVSDHVSLALDSEGNVWGWGNNEYGTLGLPNLVSYNKPTKMDSPVKFTSVSVNTYGQALGLDRNGNIWYWGAYPVEVDQSPAVPRQLTKDTVFTSVLAGSERNMAIDENGVLWDWLAATDRNASPNLTWEPQVSTNVPAGAKYATPASVKAEPADKCFPVNTDKVTFQKKDGKLLAVPAVGYVISGKSEWDLDGC